MISIRLIPFLQASLFNPYMTKVISVAKESISQKLKLKLQKYIFLN